MRDVLPEIEARGARLVIIGNGAANFAAAFREDFALEDPVFIDPELQAYRAAGLRRGRVELLSPRMPLNAIRALGKGARQDGVQGDPWQLGGVFVVRPGGDLAYRFLSAEAGDHAPVAEILAALDEDAPLVSESESPSAVQGFVGRALSAVVDPWVVPSFDRNGFRIHALAFDPDDLDVDLSGRRCLVTGANSGIGFETALALADLGAHVVLICRNAERGEVACQEIRAQTGNPNVELEILDVSDLTAVRRVGKRLAKKPVDVLVHNAGVLPDERIETADGLEATFATHVAGPFLLTELLRPRLEQAKDARVIWVSSGGMYTRALNLDDPQWTDRDYDGVLAYAETKRAQVILAELWAEAMSKHDVSVSSMHPGWADTPAVQSSLPMFRRVTSSILRTPAEGADTVVWLAAAPGAAERSGGFYFDRVRRGTCWLPGTRASQEEREALWALCTSLSADPAASRRAKAAGR